MKRICTLLAFVAASIFTHAKPVDEPTANKTGLNFLLTNTRNAFQNSTSLKLAYKSVTDATGSSTVYYYIFNSDHDFVIVAGDDQAIPILGYSDEGIFEINNMPVQVSDWLEGYKGQMQYIIANNIPANAEIQSNWDQLINGNAQAAPQQASAGVSPLLTTTWDQLPYYNADCPYDNSSKRNTVTGCVATAMAQVMKFWNYPAKGIGFHSYNDPIYGTQSASFGGTAYQWTSMPNKISNANTAIATLMYHCGVSVNMDYGIYESDANVLISQSQQQNCPEYALKTYFGYDPSLQGILRAGYSDANWISAIEAEINAGRPVIYTGTGNGGSHCFVCDGYDGNNNLHINWGWGGLYNGNFPINALNPGGVGTGGGSGDYNSNQQALIGIQPSKAFLSYNLGLFDNVKLSADSIIYQNSFGVSTSIININSNSHNFTGDICAEVFDNTNTLLDSVIISGITLNVGNNFKSDTTFRFSGSASLLPGIYNIQVFFRPSGGNWAIINNSGSYINIARLKVKWSNALELFAPITVSPVSPVQGKSISVKLDVKNTGLYQFNGVLILYLFDLSGNPVFTIQKMSDTLAPDSNFKGGITFTNANDTVSPGTYLMALFYQPNGGSYQLTGSTYYQNPIKVTIAAPPLPPDKYEPDNTADSAYVFTPAYLNDTANVSTPGANINTGSDVDYYKINLAGGYYYNIWAHLDDANFNTTNQVFTLNAVFSFSTDNGATWSATFDGNFPNSATVNGGGSIIIKVAPYFPGQTGTYKLEVHLIQTKGTGVPNILMAEQNPKIYPVPATDLLNITLENSSIIPEKFIISDMQGRKVYEQTNSNKTGDYQINTNNIPSGMYILQIQIGNGLINRQFSITK